MVEGEACLLDSNILLRISKNDDPQQPIIAKALKALIEQGVRLCYTSQTLAESGMPRRVPPTRTASA